MSNIVQNSTEYKPSKEIPVSPFLFDEKTKNEPSTFEVTFFIDGIRYQYGFSATAKKICREWLLAWPKGREQRWFERNSNESTPYFGSNLKGQPNDLLPRVKEKYLFLTVAAKWNHKQLSKVYNWFENKFRELPVKEIGVQLTDESLVNMKKSKKNHELYDLAMEIIRKADFGINDIEIEKINVDNLKFPKNMPEEVKQKILKGFSEHPPYRKNFLHCNGKYSLPLEEESEGTQRFYSFLGPLLESVAFGYTIFDDELELNMHPLLTRKLIQSVREIKSSDNKCAQLIFTTHDTTLLDPDLFGRDQVWFTEKGKDGATRLYSLADYKDVRKGEAMQKRYLSGRYGAIPILERFDLVGTKK